MDSLHNLLHNRHQQPQSDIDRLKTYVRKKHQFTPIMSLTSYHLMIYVKNSAQATSLRLDWINLNQIVNNQFKLRISMRQPKQAKTDQR